MRSAQRESRGARLERNVQGKDAPKEERCGLEGLDGDLEEPSAGEGRVVLAMAGGLALARDADGAEHPADLEPDTDPVGGLVPARHHGSAAHEGHAAVRLEGQHGHELAADADAPAVAGRLVAEGGADRDEEPVVGAGAAPEVPEVQAAGDPEPGVADRPSRVAEATGDARPAVVVVRAGGGEQPDARADPLPAPRRVEARVDGTVALHARGGLGGEPAPELVDARDEGRDLRVERVVVAAQLRLRLVHRRVARGPDGRLDLRPVLVVRSRLLEAVLVGHGLRAAQRGALDQAYRVDAVVELGDVALHPGEPPPEGVDRVGDVSERDPGRLDLPRQHLVGGRVRRDRAGQRHLDDVVQEDAGVARARDAVLREHRRGGVGVPGERSGHLLDEHLGGVRLLAEAEARQEGDPPHGRDEHQGGGRPTGVHAPHHAGENGRQSLRGVLVHEVLRTECGARSRVRQPLPHVQSKTIPSPCLIYCDGCWSRPVRLELGGGAQASGTASKSVGFMKRL